MLLASCWNNPRKWHIPTITNLFGMPKDSHTKFLSPIPFITISNICIVHTWSPPLFLSFICLSISLDPISICLCVVLPIGTLYLLANKYSWASTSCNELFVIKSSFCTSEMCSPFFLDVETSYSN